MPNRLDRALVDTEKAAGRFKMHKAFLRGGIWRNFMSRYPEANWMHKRMLEVSQRLAALPAVQCTERMHEHLHRAQANDAYWHNLMALETLLDAVSPAPTFSQRDIDCDGHDEITLRSDDLLASIREDGDAALAEFSSLPLARNLGDTLRRHSEIYHVKLQQKILQSSIQWDSAGDASSIAEKKASPQRMTASHSCMLLCRQMLNPMSVRAACFSIIGLLSMACAML